MKLNSKVTTTLQSSLHTVNYIHSGSYGGVFMPCFCLYLRKQLSVHILRTFRTHICIMNHTIPTITTSATINFKTVYYVEGRGKKRDLIFCQIARDTNYIVTLCHKYILWPSMVALMRCILQRKEARYF